MSFSYNAVNVVEQNLFPKMAASHHVMGLRERQQSRAVQYPNQHYTVERQQPRIWKDGQTLKLKLLPLFPLPPHERE